MRLAVARPFAQIVLALLLTGCVSTGTLGPLPAVSDVSNAAEIVVGRERRFVGSGNTLPVTLDGVRLFGLRVGEHVVVKVDPGDHIVGTQYMGLTFGWEDVTVVVRAEPKGRYYFRIDPAMGQALLNPISAEAGRALMSNTARVSP